MSIFKKLFGKKKDTKSDDQRQRREEPEEEGLGRPRSKTSGPTLSDRGGAAAAGDFRFYESSTRSSMAVRNSTSFDYHTHAVGNTRKSVSPTESNRSRSSVNHPVSDRSRVSFSAAAFDSRQSQRESTARSSRRASRAARDTGGDKDLSYFFTNIKTTTKAAKEAAAVAAAPRRGELYTAEEYALEEAKMVHFSPNIPGGPSVRGASMTQVREASMATQDETGSLEGDALADMLLAKLSRLPPPVPPLIPSAAGISYSELVKMRQKEEQRAKGTFPSPVEASSSGGRTAGIMKSLASLSLFGGGTISQDKRRDQVFDMMQRNSKVLKRSSHTQSHQSTYQPLLELYRPLSKKEFVRSLGAAQTLFREMAKETCLDGPKSPLSQQQSQSIASRSSNAESAADGRSSSSHLSSSSSIVSASNELHHRLEEAARVKKSILYNLEDRLVTLQTLERAIAAESAVLHENVFGNGAKPSPETERVSTNLPQNGSKEDVFHAEPEPSSSGQQQTSGRSPSVGKNGSFVERTKAVIASSKNDLESFFNSTLDTMRGTRQDINDAAGDDPTVRLSLEEEVQSTTDLLRSVEALLPPSVVTEARQAMKD